MKELRVQMWELFDALTANPEDPVRYFLDIESGSVVSVIASELDDEDAEDPVARAIYDEPDRFETVPRVETREQYRWMADFAESLESEDDDLREMLDVALAGKGAFRRFRDVVHRDGEIRARWERFHRERLLAAARSWLETLKIEPVYEFPALEPEPVAKPARPRIDLIDVLLLGSEKTELLEGKLWKRLPAKSPAEAAKHFKTLARDICRYCGVEWRKRYGVELTVNMPRATWDAFSG